MALIVSRDLFKYTPDVRRDGAPVSKSRRREEREVSPAVDVAVTGDLDLGDQEGSGKEARLLRAWTVREWSDP